MRSEVEVRELLEKLKERLKCPRCNSIEPEPVASGAVKCGRCGYPIVADHIDVGVFLALRWILKEIDTETLEETLAL